jgi:uncharacterized membrane protein YfcA
LLITVVFAGVLTGVLSGFFGIGGGTILVPILLFLGFSIKEAIGISVLQMLMASLYGSYRNSRDRLIDMSLIIPIGVGGFFGAIGSTFLVESLSNEALEKIFLLFLLYALYRVFRGGNRNSSDGEVKVHKAILLLIGAMIGFFAISIGVGGSLLLVPILVGFFNYPIKKAVATGLFFVIFSSLSGTISYSISGGIDYYYGSIIGTASILGVYIGIKLGKLSSDDLQKKLLMIFYSVVILYVGYRVIGG